MPTRRRLERALKFFDWVVEWAESKDFRGCPLQHTVSELTDAAHPARAIAHGQREWFAERFREWTTAAGVKDPKQWLARWSFCSTAPLRVRG